jgi:hypothetical protein
MRKAQYPEGSTDRDRIERRRQPRDPRASVGWETIVLQRMAARVRSSTSEPGPGAQTTTDGGWEEAALRALQRRIEDLESQ